ncbi:hypothetical protein KM043_012986 [Ampulex compressa]|nr:hypothetical protein KM043_012986 [Ampulex compressa]
MRAVRSSPCGCGCGAAAVAVRWRRRTKAGANANYQIPRRRTVTCCIAVVRSPVARMRSGPGTVPVALHLPECLSVPRTAKSRLSRPPRDAHGAFTKFSQVFTELSPRPCTLPGPPPPRDLFAVPCAFQKHPEIMVSPADS